MSKIIILLILFGGGITYLGLHNQNKETRKLGLILLGVAVGLLVLRQAFDIQLFPSQI